MECELSDDPAQATRISGRIVSFPDVTAQRVLRVSHWTSTCLHGLGSPSAIVYCSNGGRHPATGRHAATTETCRRCLREADWNASTSVCAMLLAAVTTWLEMHRGTVRVAAVTATDEPGRSEWSRPSVLQRQHGTRTRPHREAGCLQLKMSANGSTAIMPSAVASPCCLWSVRKSLVPSRAQACDAARHGGTTSPPSGIGRAAVLLGPRLCSASAGTSSRREHRHSLPTNKRLVDVFLPTLRQTGTRPADHKQPFMSVAPSLPHTEEAGPPRPPPEPPPGVSTAPPRRTTSSGSTSPCPSCSSVFSSVHNMKAHARRTNPGTPIFEGLTCGFCDSSTVFLTGASRVGHYRKCQAYQQVKNKKRNSASSNDYHSPSATSLLQPQPTTEPPTVHGKLYRRCCGNVFVFDNRVLNYLRIPLLVRHHPSKRKK
ncbi:hypothetical protein TcCL_ESM11688 [Trypanosoma cruzi]|uniref:Uncharacterized protein n=1 Tax=Trypanosoma cruzi (strain CL Brener) TaxID=353153 RepID=Q4DTW7_TRYCC|nr:hypothetical protein Tc00.1047053506973.25 [Trypanosoma cruzi]EAN95972.1 hypothetical protein Tc00.1047053506973.25 [Trypanosoma cruzi]RNC51215.1 hypothetical protein TcCL_ESM11688 [Trypanosoma cruzi]|eukprot:XP_817823.1 hypothetical protein [Trypanosoma cruzi strain CL Brener]